MSEDYVQLPPDGAGKKMRTFKTNGAFGEVHEGVQRSLLRTLTDVPLDRDVDKIGFWEDASGNIKYIKFYDGETLVFTLTVSNAGASEAETWNITRS